MKILRVILILFLIFISFPCLIAKGRVEVTLEEERDYVKLREYISRINIEEEITEKLGVQPVYLSLDECIEIALRNNFEIQSAVKLFESARYEHRHSLARFLPNFGFNGFLMFVDGQVLVGEVLVDKFSEVALSGHGYLESDLTDGGRHIFLAKSAKRIERARNHQSKFTKDEMLRRTAENYYRLLNRKLDIEILIANYYERKAHLDYSLELNGVGFGEHFDVLRFESELAQAQQSLVEAIYNFRLAQARLANVMGVEVSTPIMPVETKAKLTQLVDERETVEGLYNIALLSREDLKAKMQEIESLKQLKYATYTDFVPKVSVNAQLGGEGTAEEGVSRNNIVGFFANVPIGQNLGVGTITKAKAQQKEIEAMEFEVKQLQHNIKEGIMNAYYNSTANEQREKISRKQIEYTQESTQIAEIRFRLEQGIFLDVIQAQHLNIDSRLEYINLITEYNINQVDLLFETGVISPANVLRNYTP